MQSTQFYSKAKPKIFQYALKFSNVREDLAQYWDSINNNGGAILVSPTRMETRCVETISCARSRYGLVELVNANDIKFTSCQFKGVLRTIIVQALCQSGLIIQ